MENKDPKSKISEKHRFINRFPIALCLFAFLIFNFQSRQGRDQFPIFNPSIVHAQTDSVPAEYSDPTSSKFRIVICDGPRLPPELLAKEPNGGQDYIPCDFRGLMLQVRHLINLMMIVGVLAAIVAFSWAGGLYISGNPENKKRAHAVFPKIFAGFIIMLSAWFIVYQILSWLTKNAGFSSLIGG